MPNEVNIYTPRYLAEVVRLAPPVFTFFRDTFFTNVRTFPTKALDSDLVPLSFTRARAARCCLLPGMRP